MSRATSLMLVSVLLIAGCEVKTDAGSSADARRASSASSRAATPEAAVKPAPPAIEVPAGSALSLTLETGLSSAKSQEGELVVARLAEDVKAGGAVVLEKGSELRGRVTAAVPSGRVKGRARLAFGFDTLVVDGRERPIEVRDIDITAKSAKGRDAKVVGGAAAAGLIIGAIADGGKGAAIGTAVGGASGAGVVLATKGYEVELAAGSSLRATLEKPVKL